MFLESLAQVLRVVAIGIELVSIPLLLEESFPLLFNGTEVGVFQRKLFALSGFLLNEALLH